MRTFTLSLLLVAGLGWAADVSPDDAAAIDRDRQKAFEEIAKKHGNKLPSELSNDERKEIIKEQAAATKEVLDKHGVTAKDYSKYEATASGDQRAAQKSAKASQEKAEQDAAAAAASKAKQPSSTVENGVIIERNTDAKDKEKDKKKRR